MNKTITAIIILIVILSLGFTTEKQPITETNKKEALAIEYFFRGFEKEMVNDYAGAISDYTKAIELNPKDADYWNNRGRCKFTLEDFTGAIIDTSKALKLSSKNEADIFYQNAFYYRGVAKFGLGDKQGALEDLSKAGEYGNKKAYKAIKIMQSQ